MITNITSVLLVGGYGFFGERLTTLLGEDVGLRVIVAGRNVAKARALVGRLKAAGAKAAMEAAQFDSASASLALDIERLGARIVVNLSGPFQSADYRVAQACITARAHYIDLADAREYVLGIRRFDANARAAGVLVTSGASSVPALSSAVIDHLAGDFWRLTDIDVGISPGNQTDRGLATVAAILSYCGESIDVWRDGRWQKEAGWVNQIRHLYPEPVGRRWLTLCEVPDLTLQVERYPDVRNVTFRAGLELSVLHLGLAVMSRLRRARLLPNLAGMAPLARSLSEKVIKLGSDAGAMHVDVTGTAPDGKVLERRWTLLAEKGDGPYVPTIAAVALIRRLSEGTLPLGQATPCVGLLRLSDFEREFARLAITTREE
jgi:saccharopine dehydrogenase-like NADP-dependent oxidoreductase